MNTGVDRYPFPSPGDLPNPGIEPGSSALQADSWGNYIQYLIITHNEKNICITEPLCSTTTEEPGRLQSTGSLRVGHDWVTSVSLSCTRRGNGNPLQCSYLENARDGGTLWGVVYGVAQSQTQLRDLAAAYDTSVFTYGLFHLMFTTTLWGLEGELLF